jgi:Putative MetA-pathway of phenol degradation
MNKQYTLPLVSLLLLSAQVFSQESQTGYHLFKPVPRENMRSFALDRPDITESAQTVDAGHFQFEGDVVKWVKESQGSSPRTINIWSGLYKMGLSANWDIHLGYELFNIYQDTEGEKIDDGAGALTLRLKRNFWGNDGDKKTTFGAIPYVTFAPGSALEFNDDIQFGVGFPFSYTLTDKLGLGAQPQIDFVPDGAGGHDLSFFQAIVIGGPLVGELDFYVETVAFFNSTDNNYLLNGGLIYNISPNVKVDVAGNLGLNKTSPTRAYLGLSFRI